MPPVIDPAQEEHPVVAAVMSDSVVRAAIEVSADTPAMPLTAQRDADAIQAERVGQAAKAEATGVREAAVGVRDANVLTTAGHRRINLIWEVTQAMVAGSVTIATLIVCAWTIIYGKSPDGAFQLLSNVFFLVVGTYFQRTNHTKSSDAADTHR